MNAPAALSAPATDTLSNIEAEASLLGALLNAAPEIIDAVAPRLRAQAFAVPLHGRIYSAILAHHANEKTVTPVLLKSQFQDDEELRQVGGLRYLARLTSDPMAMLAPVEHADLITDLAARRAMFEAFSSAAAACTDPALPVGMIAALGELPLETIPSLRSRSFSFGSAFTAALDRIGDLERGKIEPGVRLDGYSDWDDLTGGMHPGAYILLGGRPSMGKTALSLGVARRAAAAGTGVLYISREMEVPQLMERMVADLLHEAGGEGTFEDVKVGRITEDDKELLGEIEDKVQALPLMIFDPETLGADQINLVIRQQKRLFERRGEQLGLVIIDYLGLIDPPAGRPNREQEVTAISKSIKAAAKLNQLPIIVLSQLSRGVDQRDDKHPQLADLRDSGSLEQDADVVIFVYRDEYYLRRSEPDHGSKKREDWESDLAAARDRMEIYTAKNRQGALCRRKSWFFGAHQAVRNSNHRAQEGLL